MVTFIGCGSVERAVASDASGQGFKSSYRQKNILNKYTVNCWKDDDKEKRPGNGHFLKKMLHLARPTLLGSSVE